MGSDFRVDKASVLGWSPSVAVALGALGAAGISLIAVAGVVVGAPGPTGSSVERNLVALAPSGALGAVCACVALVLGIVAVLSAWLLVGLALRRGDPLRPLIGIGVAWAIPLFSVHRSIAATCIATRPMV